MAESRFHPDRIIGAFGRVAAAIAAGQRRNDVLQLIAEAVCGLVDADLAAVTLILNNDDLLTVAAAGVNSPGQKGRRFHHEGASVDLVMRSGDTTVVKNLSADPEVARRIPELHLGPGVFAPLLIDGPSGMLCVSRNFGRDQFAPEEVEVIGSFASQAALVLRRECERQRAANLDRIADQARIASELQDTAISEIFAASLTMSRLANSADAEQSELAVHAIGSLDNAIKLIRQAIFGMQEKDAAALG
jgi:GAF domain-containing protein